MISSEVQRTLVKSPPELWAELGDPASLARHLGELGEIRITRAEPEKLVEWEAESAKGTVAMKGSGWGTKVTLTASRELSPPQPAPEEEPSALIAASCEEPEPSAPESSTAEPEALEEALRAEEEPSLSGLDAWSSQQAEIDVTAAERFGHEHSATLLGTDLQLAADRDCELEPDGEETAAEPAASVEPLPATASEAPVETGPHAEADGEAAEALEPRRGLFARLFGRGRKRVSAPTPAVPDQAAATTEAPAAIELAATPQEPVDTLPTPTDTVVEPAALATSEPPVEPEISTTVEADPPQPQAETPPQSDMAAELKAAEEEVEAILTGVLDRLGAAHHRPFSRS